MQKPLILYHAHRLSQCCRVKISDPYYPFGEIYSCASWNHGTVSANPNYIWWPANQWKLPEYSLLFLPQAEREQQVMNDLPPPPTPKLTHWRGMREGGGGGRSRSVTWRRGVSRQFYWDTHRRQTWTSSVVPDASQHWLYKPSRQEMAVSVVHWYSVTGRLLWRSLKQPSVPL